MPSSSLVPRAVRFIEREPGFWVPAIEIWFQLGNVVRIIRRGMRDCTVHVTYSPSMSAQSPDTLFIFKGRHRIGSRTTCFFTELETHSLVNNARKI